MTFRIALAASAVALAGGGAAHAVVGCTTVTSPSATLCSFMADSDTGKVFATTVWSLRDDTDNVPAGFGGAYNPLNQGDSTIVLIAGHAYTLQINTGGVGVVESGL